jgi:3-dehydroquinate synthase
MKTFTIDTKGRRSQIYVGKRMDDLDQLIPQHAIIITDQNVDAIYGRLWEKRRKILIGIGEKNKTLATMNYIYSQLLNFGVDRSGFIVGVGGGIVCDIAGFAASTFLRGIDFSFLPTTLLAQVDAAIGGKNGVNFKGFKNMVGTFNQPKFILSDPLVLQTLPPKELQNGFAEIVKHALIADAAMFGYMQQRINAMLDLEPEVINHLITRSVEIKSAIVNRDEHEKGERRKLNLGHTFGHAIEKIAGISHGKAVSIGMVMASKIALQKGYISQNDLSAIAGLLQSVGLPVELLAETDELINAIYMDKKRENDFVHFILPKGIGQVIIEKITIQELKKFTF